jgi:hypothetical protein
MTISEPVSGHKAARPGIYLVPPPAVNQHSAKRLFQKTKRGTQRSHARAECPSKPQAGSRNKLGR